MIIATIHQQSSLKALKQAGCDAVIVGIEHLSLHATCTIQLSELKQWKQACKEQGVLLYVNLLKMMMDEDLESVNSSLRVCKEVGVDGFYFADEGVLQIAKELDYERAGIYQPETLVANHLDAKFYMDQGIQAVSLAHELSLEEIHKISKTSGLEVLINGYFSILYSRRPLVTNYLKQEKINKDQTSYHYDLIEQTRTDRMPIIQDETGTHIFSEQPIQSKAELDALQSFGISRFRIDSLFFNDEWTLSILNAYKGNEPMPGSDHWYHEQTIRKKEEQTNE